MKRGGLFERGGLIEDLWYFFFFARKSEKEKKKIHRLNPIFGIILLFIDNDGHVTNHVTNVRLRDTS